MLMDEPLIAGGLAISGLFDLEPIRLCYLNEKLGLDAEQARRNSPPRSRHSPPGSGGVTPPPRCRRCKRIAELKVRIRSPSPVSRPNSEFSESQLPATHK
jgi:hypothetical protein